MVFNRYGAAGLALSAAVSLYTVNAIPRGTIAQNWGADQAASADSPASTRALFPAEPLLRLEESTPLPLTRSDSLSLVRGAGGETESASPGPEFVGLGTELAPVSDVPDVAVKVLLERHPWLGPIGAKKLGLLLRDGRIEDHGVWGACSRLGLYSECLQACRASGAGCKPE